MTLDGDWKVELMETNGELSPLVNGSEISVNVGDGRVSGGALNRFMGGLGEDTLLAPWRVQ